MSSVLVLMTPLIGNKRIATSTSDTYPGLHSSFCGSNRPTGGWLVNLSPAFSMVRNRSSP